jgi:hypothetical protein
VSADLLHAENNSLIEPSSCNDLEINCAAADIGRNASTNAVATVADQCCRSSDPAAQFELAEKALSLWQQARRIEQSRVRR